MRQRITLSQRRRQQVRTGQTDDPVVGPVLHHPKMFHDIKAWGEQCERGCFRKTPTVGLRGPLYRLSDIGEVQRWD